MEIKHDKKAMRLDLYDDSGAHIGKIEYEMRERGVLHATHTLVYSAYEGRGYARRLLDALVAFARQTECKIVPVCSYVVDAFRKTPEKYADVQK